MSNVMRSTEMLHPLLVGIVARIQSNVIEKHSLPLRLFETGRLNERHSKLLLKGKSRDPISPHLFNLLKFPDTIFRYLFSNPSSLTRNLLRCTLP